MKVATAKVKLTHPDRTKAPGMPKIDRDKYESMKKAILEVVPATEPGIAFQDLPGAVKKKLPAVTWKGASLPWYTTGVKLDLEGRGLIKRLEGSSPQRIVRGRR